MGGAFGTIEDSYQKVRSDTAEPAGIVRLSTVTAYGKHCVLPLLPRFFQRYPQIELVMSLHDGSRGMTRQESDIRINWGEDKEKDKVSQLLCTMPLILVASPDTSRSAGRRVRWTTWRLMTASMWPCRMAAARTGRSCPGMDSGATGCR